MALTLLCGFEMQSTGEPFSKTGTAAISTSVFRSGLASLQCNPSVGSAAVNFQIRPSGGTLTTFAQSARFYARFDAVSGAALQIAAAGNAVSDAAGWILYINSSGTFTLGDGAGANNSTSANAITINDKVFHRIEVDSNGTSRTLYVDGVQWIAVTGITAAAAQTTFQLGSLVAITYNVFFDDLAVFDATIGAPATGANNIVALLLPTAGTNAGGWTDGAGGTGDIHGSVDNIPPVGVLASTAAAKIKNATSTTTGDYVATMQSYLVGGIPAGSIINAVQAICSHGEEVTTGNPKPGAVWIASNPAQTAGTGTFDYGNNVIEGTYPTGWPSHSGPVAVSPSVTLGTAPTVTVRKNLASTRVTGCCFIGMYVDYTPPPIAKPVTVLQAVKRASYW